MKKMLMTNNVQKMTVANDEIFDDEGLIFRLSEIDNLKKNNESLVRLENEKVERMNAEIRWLSQCYSATSASVA